MTTTRTRWLVQSVATQRFLVADTEDVGPMGQQVWWTGRAERALQAVDPIALARKVRSVMPHAGDALRLVAVRFRLISHDPPRWCADE
jgi:hypothetical protein